MAENEVQKLKEKKVVNGEAEKAVITVSAIMPKLLVEAPKANEAIQFYKNAFGAVEVSRSLHSKRKADQDLPLVHEAQLKIGGATILVSDNFDDSEALEKTGSLDSIRCVPGN